MHGPTEETDMRARILLIAGALATGLVAPAGAAHAATDRGNAAGTTDARGRAAITTTTAKKLAKAGGLTKRDMPGLAAAAQTHDSTDVAAERAFYKCLGAKVPSYLARNYGTSFTADPLEVDSSADVFRTAAAAKADLKLATANPTRTARCLKQQGTAVFKQQGATVHSFTVTPITVKISGVDALFAYRFVAKLTIQGQDVKLVGHEIDAVIGYTEISLSPSVYNASAPATSTTITLVKRLAKRVRAV
jgi:hypothetical protein